MEYALFSLWQQSKAEAEKRQLTLCNEKTERFGLVLSEQERNELILCRNQSLKKYGRIEFGQGILENTCLPRFAAAVRGGYRGYMDTEGYGEYAQFDEESRWDEGLFYQTLGELTEG